MSPSTRAVKSTTEISITSSSRSEIHQLPTSVYSDITEIASTQRQHICGLVVCVIGSVLVVALKGSSTPVLLHRSEIVKAASLISEEGCKIT
jgi:hypothetical protein